jgi:hypothetical protein
MSHYNINILSNLISLLCLPNNYNIFKNKNRQKLELKHKNFSFQSVEASNMFPVPPIQPTPIWHTLDTPQQVFYERNIFYWLGHLLDSNTYTSAEINYSIEHTNKIMSSILKSCKRIMQTTNGDKRILNTVTVICNHLFTDGTICFLKQNFYYLWTPIL